jgi:hypothetical protein
MRLRANRVAVVAICAIGATLGACVPGAVPGGAGAPGAPQIVAPRAGSVGRIEVRRIEARPRLTLVSRDGDPTPALVAAVATDLGPVLTTALAATVEARLVAAGFAVDTRVDSSAFRVRFLLADPARASAFLTALAQAFSRPIVAGSPELALAASRLLALKRNPFDAPEVLAIAACTGALGVAPGDRGADPARSPDDARALEIARGQVLHAGRTAIAAVGPAAFTTAVAAGLAESQGWPVGDAARDPWPTTEAVGAYTTAAIDRRGARVTLAVRTADPEAAASAAEHLGAVDSPLVARLRGLAQPWHVLDVSGVARPSGGCVSVTIEGPARPTGATIESAAAQAGALVRAEITTEISLAAGSAVSGRQILAAADPRDAAARAAWWSLSTTAPGSPNAWATTLAVPAASTLPPRVGAPPPAPEVSATRFQSAYAEGLATTSASAIAERRLAVERGQGEIWVLVASPCGVAEEGLDDAGLGAVAAIAAVESRRHDGAAQLDPWITSDGVGVLAHASFRDDHETPIELARRVGGAAARALAAPMLTTDIAGVARATTLDLLARAEGPEGGAASVFASSIAPGHPAWVEPLGLWTNVASSALEDVRLHQRALASGPLRVAVIANADGGQAQAAADAVDRWLTPGPARRACASTSPLPPRPGRYEAHLPEGGSLARAIIGAPIPAPGAPGRDLAELARLALDGDRGLLASAFTQAAGRASARILGGSRAPSLVIDVRAPSDGLAAAVTEVKLMLARLPQATTEADLDRAFAEQARLDQEGRADPRRRLVDLWAARPPVSRVKPALPAFRAFLGDALKDAALIVVEARPE